MHTPDDGPATSACPGCGGHPTWESVLDGDEERWLAICCCGWMRAFLPEQPALQPEDSLRAFLLGPGRPIFPPSPPWVRIFLASVEATNPVRWRFCHAPCPRCRASASFGLQVAQRVTLEMHAEMWRAGTLQAEEDHVLNIGRYFRNELLLMLERPGFADAVVQGDHNDAEATSDDDFLVFVATK